MDSLRRRVAELEAELRSARAAARPPQGARDCAPALDAGMAQGTQERLRHLVDNIADMVIEIDVQGRHTCVNRAVEAVLGYSVEEFLAKRPEELVVPEHRSVLMDRLRRRAAGETFRDAVGYEVLAKDGRRVFLETRASPLFSDGVLTGFLAIARDVTERRRAEQALREGEQQLRSLFQNSPIGIYRTTPDGRILMANAALVRMLGYSSFEELSRRNLEQEGFEPTYPRARFKEELERSGAISDWESVWVCRDGRRVNVRESARVVRGADGRVMCYEGTVEDITERKQAEEDLRESRESLQRIIDNTWDIIFQIDLRGNYTFANRAAERITGYPLERLLRMNMSELLAPEYVKPTRDRLRRRIAGETLEQPFLCEIVHRDGHRVHIEMTTSALLQGGKLHAVLGLARDVSERVRSEEILAAARGRLITARDEERRHLAMELHDSLGQKMVAAHMALQGLLEDAQGALTEQQIETLAGLTEGCQEMIQEVRQIGYGLYPPALETLGLSAAVRQLAGYGQRKLKTIVSGNLGGMRFSPEVEIELFRIAQQAVNNALRHSQASRLRIRLDYRKGSLTLTVVDNGAGFDVWSARGKGLGLSTMEERAKAIGGEFRVTSRPGRTSVQVRAPAEPSPVGK